MMRRLGTIALAALLIFAFVTVAHARVGGGHSYSGGGSGSGGGGGGGAELIFYVIRALFWLTINYPAIGIPVDIVVIVVVIRLRTSSGATKDVVLLHASTRDPGTLPLTDNIEGLRRFDPNFSEIVFSDFCYSLYGRVQEARGAGDLDRYAPYLSAGARSSLKSGNPEGLREVRGVVVGSFKIIGARLATTVSASVEYEANLTEVTATGQDSWYVIERWTFERQREILSPPPEKAKAEHCPRCGAALKTRTDGSCEYCGVKITSGAFNWYVQSVTVLGKDPRGPLLTSNVPEQGTESPTVMQPDFRSRMAEFQTSHPDFRWPEFEQRVRDTYTTLQNAWAARDWERVRPLESEPLFQMHRYWIDAYVREHLRNVVEAFEVSRVEPVKVSADPFYDAITVRVYASGRDFTIDDAEKVVSGSRDQLRRWTEYWTFIRTRATQSDPTKTVSCPNCGAAVVVGTSGICSHCGGKLTSGDFGWVLSRIEQDEAYAG
jgi:ribosomal protein L37AE/L43A